MIYTLTLNPSIDCALYVSNFEIGETNRSLLEDVRAGGKGINVSRMLNILGCKNMALAVIAGDTGDYFEKLVRNENLTYEFFRLHKGETRINVKIEGNKETEINAVGPNIDEEQFGRLTLKLMDLSHDDTLIISGSSLPNLDSNIYERIMTSLSPGVTVIVDSAGDLLKNALKAKPFLVKPNFKELEEITGKKIRNDKMLIEAMNEIQEAGAKNVIVSLGDQGAAMLTRDGKIIMAKANDDKLVNSVGAGDCLLAGFVDTYHKTKDMRMALINGVACGSAKAYSKNFPSTLKVNEVKMQVELRDVNLNEAE